MSDGWRATKVASCAGFAFAMLEAASAFIYPVPLDPLPTLLAIGLSVIGTGVVLGLVALVVSAFSARYAAGITMALWASVWGPHQAEVAGWHRVGWAPAVSIGGLAFVAPSLAVGVGVLGGGAGAFFRRRGGTEGLTPIVRDAAERSTAPDILLVTIDGVGADTSLLNFGQWRSDSDFSPVQGWTHFSEAFAAGPWVLPSLHSIMSGQPVRSHGGGLPTQTGVSRRLSSSVPFPYVLQQAGYHSSAFLASPYLTEEQGFADGFDRWSHCADSVEPIILLHHWNRLVSAWTDQPREIDRTRNARLASAAMDRMATPGDGPQFIWVHMVPTKGFGFQGENDDSEASPPVKEVRQLIRKMVRNSDGWVIAIAGTHSDSRGGDRGGESAAELSDEALHVPLAIRRPNTQGGVVRRPVATSDLAQSILAVAAKGRHFPGKNLMTVRRDPIEVGGVLQDGGLFAARTASGKYLKRDPGEVGPGAAISDRTEENLRRSGYLD